LINSCLAQAKLKEHFLKLHGDEKEQFRIQGEDYVKKILCMFLACCKNDTSVALAEVKPRISELVSERQQQK